MRELSNRDHSSSIPVHHGGGRYSSSVTSFQNDMNRLFDNFFGDTSLMSSSGKNSFPAIDIIEDIKHYEIKAELPGMDPDDIEVAISSGYLTLKGEHSEGKGNQDKNYLYSERSYGSFQRTVPLPDAADGNQASEATFKDGILTINIPKKEDAIQESRKLKINRKK